MTLKLIWLRTLLYLEMVYRVWSAPLYDHDTRFPVPRTLYCSQVLMNGLFHLYDDEIEVELDDQLEARGEEGFSEDWSETLSRVRAEERFVCGLLYVECLEDVDCTEDLRLALPYWYGVWSGADPECPPPLEDYICRGRNP